MNKISLKPVMRNLFLGLCTAPLLVSSFVLADYGKQAERMASGRWERTDVAQRAGKCNIQEIKIGNGRNDGIRRLYVASPGNDCVDEYTWDGATWQRVVVGTSAECPRDLCLGKTRNDGLVRVYAAHGTETLNEYTWDGSAWAAAMVCAEIQSLGVTVGRLGADKVTRIYKSKHRELGRPTNIVYEITRDGTSWHLEPFKVGASNSNSLKLGDGRNDGVTRLYAANHDGHIYEISRDDVPGIEDLGDCGGPLTDVAIGPGRGDGINRVYGACRDGSLHEFSWNGKSWEKSAVLKPKRSKFLREVVIGAGRGDGVDRVYCAGTGSGVVEFTWTGSAWVESRIERKEVDGLAIGDARNDGIVRLYAGSGEYKFIADKREN